MKLLPARLNDKPQYVFHPGRALRRTARGRRAPDGPPVVTQLPWGLPLEVHEGDAIGYSILTGGVFDPCVTEVAHRLVDPGDLVVDVGANIGYFTSLAAARSGPSGAVLAFEPHPRTRSLLDANVERWRGSPGVAPVETHEVALSDSAGTATLSCGSDFDANMGLPSLVPGSTPDGVNLLAVRTARLDDVLGERQVGLLKIDVEGHETAVLRGAVDLLTSGRVRDVVFEDHDEYPDASTRIVEEAGLTLFGLANDLFGPTVCAPRDRGEMPAWPGPSYLATRDPQRALARLRPRGWRVPGIGLGLPLPARRRAD